MFDHVSSKYGYKFNDTTGEQEFKETILLEHIIDGGSMFDQNVDNVYVDLEYRSDWLLRIKVSHN